ncbi:MAG: NAD(P)/FAD-dependent oxidoreductase [Candidatus Heimdallarchaeaceae archaeon]
MKVVIIGFGTAGWLTVVNLRVFDRKSEIVVVDEKSYDIYHPCSMPYAIGGLFSDETPLIEAFNDKLMKVKFYRRHRALSIDRSNKTVQIKNLETDEIVSLSYDKLVLATGSQPWSPPIPGHDAPNVYSLKWIEDSKKIREAANSASKAVVIGASAIGLEVGTELARRGIQTVVVELLPHILPKALDQDFAEFLTSETLKNLPNLKILTGVKAERIELDDKGFATKVVTDNGTFEADFVVMATGVRPNVSLAKNAGLEIGNYGGIVVNECMETSDPDILAVGDCVQTIDMIDQSPILALLASSASRMARVAGLTLAKPGKIVFPGTLNNFIVPVHNLRVGSVGLTSHVAKERGYNIHVGKIRTTDKPEHMPDAKELLFKVLVDKESGQILGAQAIGSDAITDNLNIISLAIQSKMTVSDLLNSDLCYAPAVNDTIYPVIKAAEIVARRLFK